VVIITTVEIGTTIATTTAVLIIGTVITGTTVTTGMTPILMEH